MALSFSLPVVLTGVDRLTAPLGRATGALGKFGDKAKKTGRKLTAGLTLPIIAFGAASVATALSFDKGLNLVSARTGVVREDMRELEDQAISLGASTAFSARQATDAMGFFAQAGLEVNEIMAVTPQVLNLAAAASMDLGETAIVLTGAMKGYALGVDQSLRVTDVLALTTNRAATDLRQLSEGFTMAGPTARSAGIEFETTAAILGVLADNQFKSTMGGTALRGAIVRLIKPAAEARAAFRNLKIKKEDILAADGTLKDFLGTLDLLRANNAKPAQIFSIFGLRAGPAMLSILAQGTSGIRELNQELLDRTVPAARIADLQLQGATGAVVRLKSSFEGLLISIANSGLLAAFEVVVVKVTGIVRAIGQMNPRVLKIGTIIAGVLAVIGPALIILGAFAAAIVSIGAAWAIVTPAFTAVAGFITAVLIPAIVTLVVTFWPVILVVFALVAAGMVLKQNWGRITSALKAMWFGLKVAAALVFGFIKDTFLGLVNLLPDWVINLFKGDSPKVSASITETVNASSLDRAVGAKPGGPPAGDRGAHVRVSFEDLPVGARVDAESDPDFPVDVETGFAMVAG